MRRKYSIFIYVCLILTLFTATAYASSIKSTNYQTRFTHIDIFENTFDISSSGQATVNSYLTARNVDSVTVTAKLQQYTDRDWKTIKSWTKTRDGTRCGGGIGITSIIDYRINDKNYLLYSISFGSGIIGSKIAYFDLLNCHEKIIYRKKSFENKFLILGFDKQKDIYI